MEKMDDLFLTEQFKHLLDTVDVDQKKELSMCFVVQHLSFAQNRNEFTKGPAIVFLTVIDLLMTFSSGFALFL